MGEIKSAWELAMEKVEKLGKLSDEELKKQRQEKWETLAQALLDKYLGGLALWQIEVDIQKQRESERAGIKDCLARKMVSSIELGNAARLERVAEGLKALRDNAGAMDEVVGEIRMLFNEYAGEKDRESRSIEGAAGEILHQLRISGSAIAAVNPSVVPEWQAMLEDRARPFNERLDVLKERLAGVL